jgi:carbon monoxide dehydrogenase subunit G
MNLLSVSRVIDAPIGEVWAITSAFGSIKTWMSGIERVSVTGAGIGAERTIQSSLGIAVERMVAIDARRHHIRYAITGEALSGWDGFVGGTDLESVGTDATRITWVAEAAMVPAGSEATIAFLEGFVTESIAGLGRLLDARVHGGTHDA